MSFRENLSGILLAGTVIFGTSGCFHKNPEMYVYNGKIEEDSVKFERSRGNWLEYQYTLTVKRLDGKIIKYFDKSGENFIIESVEITTKDGKTLSYNMENEVGRSVIFEAQSQFVNYLKSIKDTKVEDALKNIR